MLSQGMRDQAIRTGRRVGQPPSSHSPARHSLAPPSALVASRSSRPCPYMACHHPCASQVVFRPRNTTRSPLRKVECPHAADPCGIVADPPAATAVDRDLGRDGAEFRPLVSPRGGAGGQSGSGSRASRSSLAAGSEPQSRRVCVASGKVDASVECPRRSVPPCCRGWRSCHARVSDIAMAHPR